MMSGRLALNKFTFTILFANSTVHINIAYSQMSSFFTFLYALVKQEDENFVNAWKVTMQLISKYDDEILVPNWLIEVFAFIKREELIQKNSHYASLPISCRIFNKLCLPKLFGNVPPHSISKLTIKSYKEYHHWTRCPYDVILCEKRYLDSTSTSTVLSELPTTPPPKYIIGFGRIDLMYLDDQIIEFLHNILPSLNSIKLIIDLRDSHWSKRQWIPAIGHLIKMMASKIRTSKLQVRLANLAAFNRIFPSILPTIQCMAVELDGTDLNLLIEWLIKMERKSPREPRILILSYNNFEDRCQEFILIELIKEEFIHSRNPICFSIFPIHFADDFTMKNEQTGEILRLSDKILIRQPRGYPNVNNSIEENDGSTTIYIGIKKLVKIIKSIN